MRKRKPITPEMLRACFGPDAEITKHLGRYKVMTRDGGEVKITDRHINPVHVSRDAYAGCARLVREAWGEGRLSGDSPDFKLAMMAHGEAEGVVFRVKERGGFARAVICSLIAWMGIAFSDPHGPWPFVWLFIAGVLWLVLKRAAKRQAQHENEQMSVPYPRTGGDAHEASDEDLKKGRWT